MPAATQDNLVLDILEVGISSSRPYVRHPSVSEGTCYSSAEYYGGGERFNYRGSMGEAG